MEPMRGKIEAPTPHVQISRLHRHHPARFAPGSTIAPCPYPWGAIPYQLSSLRREQLQQICSRAQQVCH
jgi:hypothetical protein